MGNTMQQFESIITPQLETLARVLNPVLRGLHAMYRAHQFSKVLHDAGWLPHYTTPLLIVEECSGDACAVRDRLNQHYEQNWSSVRMTIESKIDEFDIDDEAKATFREALDAHGFGLYRSVCRLLFPEIERVYRTELFQRRTGPGKYNEMVSKLVEDRTLEEFLPGGWLDFDYFGHLTAAVRRSAAIRRCSGDTFDERIFGLFRTVDSEDLQRVEQDAVPNRHAAMHGYVSYSSRQNSLNAIFVADYVFRIIGSFKSTKSEVG